MQLVGAKPNFIQKPFLIRASFHGILSGIIASALIAMLLYYSYSEIEDLKMLYDQENLITVIYNDEFRDNYHVIKTELLNTGYVEAMTRSNTP